MQREVFRRFAELRHEINQSRRAARELRGAAMEMLKEIQKRKAR